MFVYSTKSVLVRDVRTVTDEEVQLHPWYTIDRMPHILPNVPALVRLCALPDVNYFLLRYR